MFWSSADYIYCGGRAEKSSGDTEAIIKFCAQHYSGFYGDAGIKKPTVLADIQKYSTARPVNVDELEGHRSIPVQGTGLDYRLDPL